MDGTALGIFGTLPNFYRHTESVMPIKGLPGKQYIIRGPKLRVFIDAILVSAKGNGENPFFFVRMKLSLRRYQDTLFTRLFFSEESSKEGTNLVKRFFASFLSVQFAESHDGAFEYKSEYDSDGEKWRVSHKVSDTDIRRTILELGQCFLSGSIARGSLRSEESVIHAKEIATELSKFASCTHGTSVICDHCRKNLYLTGRKAESSLSSAGRVPCAISSAIRVSQGLNLRNIAIVLLDIIWKAIDVRNRYQDLFQANQTEDIRSYNLLHREGTSSANTSDRNWLSEAQKTGEFFSRASTLNDIW